MIGVSPIEKTRWGYRPRVLFNRQELLSSLPEEMLAAQANIPGNAHCNGEFCVGENGNLMCRMEVEGHAQYYIWMIPEKRWNRND